MSEKDSGKTTVQRKSQSDETASRLIKNNEKGYEIEPSDIVD